eukprot:360675-Chlamydomonas_euryale.AAC.15
MAHGPWRHVGPALYDWLRGWLADSLQLRTSATTPETHRPVAYAPAGAPAMYAGAPGVSPTACAVAPAARLEPPLKPRPVKAATAAIS